MPGNKYPSLILKDFIHIQSNLRFFFRKAKAVARRCSVKKVFLNISQNLQENTSAGVAFLIRLESVQLYQKDNLAKVFSGEFCKILKNKYFVEHLRTAASENEQRNRFNPSLPNLGRREKINFYFHTFLW